MGQRINECWRTGLEAPVLGMPGPACSTAGLVASSGVNEWGNE